MDGFPVFGKIPAVWRNLGMDGIPVLGKIPAVCMEFQYREKFQPSGGLGMDGIQSGSVSEEIEGVLLRQS